MGYLRTILTYSVPSEAEVDQSFLEANGITVNLLNAEVTRFEIGRPFDIHLQVPEEQAARAITLLRETHPERFGSVDNVNKITADIRQAMIQLVLCGLVCASGLFVLGPAQPSLSARALFSVLVGAPLGAAIRLFLWVIFRR